MSRSVLYGKPISDSSSVAQAYRAKRYNRKIYPNSLQGTEETAGEVLFYNLMPAITIFTASNGGRTTSYHERWGGAEKPYLIAQDDAWDAAVGEPKRGTGVGMSQLGAVYAAKIGYHYQQILAFYYPHTKLVENYEDKEGIKMALENTTTFSRTLKKGTSGAEVVLLQNILNSLGFSSGTVDGNFGKQTEAAVKSFQKKYGLKEDGIVGSVTGSKLLELYKPEDEPTPEPESDIKDAVEIIKDELLAIQKQVALLKSKIDALIK